MYWPKLWPRRCKYIVYVMYIAYLCIYEAACLCADIFGCKRTYLIISIVYIRTFGEGKWRELFVYKICTELNRRIQASSANSLQELISGMVLELTGGYVFLGIMVLDPQKETWLVAKDWISSQWTGKRCRNLADWAKIGTIAYADLRTSYIAPRRCLWC